MKAKLLPTINELLIRDYNLIEDEGINRVLSNYPEIKRIHEEDEETGKKMMVIVGPDLASLLKFLDFADIQVRILM